MRHARRRQGPVPGVYVRRGDAEGSKRREENQREVRPQGGLRPLPLPAQFARVRVGFVLEKPESPLARGLDRRDVRAAARIFRRRIAATPRPRRGYSVEISRGGAAAATRIFREERAPANVSLVDPNFCSLLQEDGAGSPTRQESADAVLVRPRSRPPQVGRAVRRILLPRARRGRHPRSLRPDDRRIHFKSGDAGALGTTPKKREARGRGAAVSRLPRELLAFGHRENARPFQTGRRARQSEVYRRPSGIHRGASRRIGPSRLPSSRVDRGPAAGCHVDIPRDDATLQKPSQTVFVTNSVAPGSCGASWRAST